MQFLMALVIILGLASCGWAGVIYYVDSADGNDAWNGLAPTYENNVRGPFKTLAKVNSLSIKPGDIIKFRCGQTYFGQLNIYFTGSKKALVTITSYAVGKDNPALKPVLHGGMKITGWTYRGNGIYSKYMPFTSPKWQFENDIALKKASSSSCTDGNWYYDIEAKTLYYKPINGNPEEDAYTLTKPMTIWIRADCEYLTIDNLKFVASGIYASNHKLDHITVQNCDFSNCYMGIRFDLGSCIQSGRNITIKNNYFDYCRENIYFINQRSPYLGWDKIIISKNKITHSNGLTNGEIWETAGDRDGISLQHLSNSIVEYNDISGHCDEVAGITHWASPKEDATATGNIFRYNYIHDVEGSGICIGSGRLATMNFEIYCNIIANFGTGRTRKYYGGLRLNSKQTENQPTKVYNNTIYNGDVGIFLYSYPHNYHIFNNIISNISKYYIYCFSGKDNEINFNCYGPTTGGNHFNYLNTEYNWTGWRTITGFDKNSLNEDAKLINPARGDFHLNTASPCIKAGTPVGLKTDLQGRFWNHPPSLGALEYSP